MAIYCSKCGKEHPDDALFCMKCGTSLKAAVPAATQTEPKWEHCEIMFDTRIVKHGWILPEDWFFHFWANGVGPKGQFHAGAGPEVKGTLNPNSSESSHQHALNELIKLLTSQGWEPVSTKGPAWFSHKFRRRVR